MTVHFSKSNLPKQLFINNEYVESRNTRKLVLRNPKDNSLVADDVPLAGELDVDVAVEAAEKAFPAWKKMSATLRRGIMNKLADLIDAHRDELAELTRITLGAPAATFGAFESGIASECFRYYAGWTDKLPGESFPQDNGFMKIVRNEPLGVVAGIVPWNGPLASVGFKAGPALAAGNCFILKPSEKTPLASLALGHLIVEAGFPPGVFQVLSGDGTTGALLASHMRIRKISFTGSIATGKRIQEASAKSNLKRVTLELGGKSPAIIFDDCNVENAITWAAQAITTNTGQVCFAASRVYVQEGIYDEFMAGYRAALEDFTKGAGDPDDSSTVMGPLVDESQFKRVRGFVERGQDGQGTLLAGGKQIGSKASSLPRTAWKYACLTEPQGFYIEPTIFTNVSSTAEIMTQEIFGPVVVVNTFKTEEEVINIANESEYGLMAGVFTQDINRAMRFASDLDSGMVGINCVSLLHLSVPFGGTKQSGVGRECGVAAMKAYTEPKTILVNLLY
ncbi:MAG: hypothetical protein M1818_004532 [Claussenomyces sp. TS43310]|nr:MAG: hypothetical protein M1818_004532 [Claussenomyces sp. TS43310]